MLHIGLWVHLLQSKFGGAALVLKIGYWVFNAARVLFGDPTVWVEGALAAEFGPVVAEQVLQFFGDAAFLADVLQNFRRLTSAFKTFVPTVVGWLRRWGRPDAASLMAEAGTINDLFLEYDTNQDGYISRGEFNDFAKHFLRLQNPLDVSHMFAIFDTNGDREYFCKPADHRKKLCLSPTKQHLYVCSRCTFCLDV